MSYSYKISNYTYPSNIVTTLRTGIILPFYIALYDTANNKGISITDINSILNITITDVDNVYTFSISDKSIYNDSNTNTSVLSLSVGFSPKAFDAVTIQTKISYTYNGIKSPDLICNIQYVTIMQPITAAYYIIINLNNIALYTERSTSGTLIRRAEKGVMFSAEIDSTFVYVYNTATSTWIGRVRTLEDIGKNNSNTNPFIIDDLTQYYDKYDY